ncbi:MAG: right-handed parallel beta-helix repeat-containing protein [Lentisphaerae bacterium]|jgi:hypothetical protein|nr:right-handed parallel beta-helix repeat-containing protein [Lentisphaerota bacterium]MBT4821957.1 right-handed parallel beta-helix repeat-containing protein [Lentisphaerota bacterium]MBT5605761.1 right-handed parallel beta-helix repeat-containing protein [Lentisphaerota bacterium]MBT7053916.1 right-handed parallel beta-helix repeat-containing protein [Lentisphaerota bacterium]MBT7843942.1 right-handed parallel beta-helix repeat-containing protein [Lentisphaerota bacterium]
MVPDIHRSLFIALLLSISGASYGARNEAMIAEVTSGKRHEARASWWGGEPTESTVALQAAIDSGVRKLVIDNVGAPWIVDKIRLMSDQELVFEEGVVVLAKKGAFKGKTDALFSASLKKNIRLIGYGAVLRMHKGDYTTDAYEKAEWRHTLSLLSCDNVQVRGLTLADSGGDGIYLGVAKRGVPCSNIHIKDVICDNHHRQGISVISAENLLIEDTVMKNTAGTNPQAGVDFEPNHPGERLVNCVMRNCLSENNVGGAYALYVVPLDGTSAPMSIRLENCRGTTSAFGLNLLTSNGGDGGSPRGTVDVVGCTFADMRGAGIVVTNVPAERMATRFVRCTVTGAATEQPETSPIMLSTRSGAYDPVGDIAFVDCTIEDSVERRPLRYVDVVGDIQLTEVTGTLLLKRNGVTERVALTSDVLDEWIPARKLKHIPRLKLDLGTLTPTAVDPPAAELQPQPVRQRLAVTYLLYALAGDPVSLSFSYDQVGRYGGSKMPVRVTSRTGDIVATATVPFQKESTVAFRAPMTGVYTVTCKPGGNSSVPRRSSHVLCLAPSRGCFPLHGFTGRLYFWVPRGTTEFGVKVSGEGGEAVKATVFDATGTQVWTEDNITEACMFDTVRSATSQGEVWCVELARPSAAPFEDYFVDLRGVPPILGFSPQALLQPAPVRVP